LSGIKILEFENPSFRPASILKIKQFEVFQQPFDRF